MGCGLSKDASASGGEAPDSAASIIPSFDKIKVPDSTQINEALSKFTSRASVVDQMMIAKQIFGENAKKGARQLHNIFAAPLGDMADFAAPSYPKSKEEQAFIQEAIDQNFVFSNLKQTETKTMIAAFEKVSHKKGDIIIQQGDTGDYFYVIREGDIAFSVSQKNVGTAEAGATFGELALLYSAPRAATCTVVSDKCALYRVDQKTFRYILQTQTQSADMMKRELLAGITFLQQLDDADLNKLVGTLTPRPFAKGELIVKKGTEGDAFYVIQEGSVAVKDIEAGGQSYENTILSKGDYFGERALVTKEARAANCIGGTSGILLWVDREIFQKVMGELSALVLKASDKRRLAALKIMQTTHMNPSDLTILAELIVDETHAAEKVLFKEDDSIESTFYIVREGEVLLTCSSETDNEMYNNKTIGPGGFFGDEMLARDAQRGNDSEPTSTARFTATCKSEEVTLGLLTLRECRTVIDTTRIGKDKKANHRMSIKDSDIQLASLKKHAILGAGTFGQVWLVSRPTSAGKGARQPYALKIQSKHELIRHSQARGVVQEKQITAKLHHPFIINLVTTYQDRQRVYMLLGIVQGGELFSVLHQTMYDGVTEKSAKFYAAGIHEGLSHMHRRHVLYRDLKPENVLIDHTGYPVIVDLGFAKYVVDKTYTLCGTPLYIAPEVVLNRGHDKGADHWSLGVLIFEMISGYTPFYQEGMDQITLFRAVVKGKIDWPMKTKKLFSDEARDVITRLLVIDPTQRLGSLARGEKDIYRAPWFKDMSFEELVKKNIKAPWIPKIKDPLDTSNFENWDHLEDKAKSNDPAISKKQDEIFSVF